MCQKSGCNPEYPVNLSSNEAEFVTTSQAGQQVVYLREILKGFGHSQKQPTELWEDNDSCILMSENPTNRDRLVGFS